MHREVIPGDRGQRSWGQRHHMAFRGYTKGGFLATAGTGGGRGGHLVAGRSGGSGEARGAGSALQEREGVAASPGLRPRRPEARPAHLFSAFSFLSPFSLKCTEWGGCVGGESSS